MIRNIKQFLVFLLLVSWPAHAHGDVYVWTDDKGIRHYSNISHPGRGEVTREREASLSAHPGEDFMVLRVFDGDTLEARGAGLTFKIRLAGIDTPETGRRNQKGQPFALKAKQALKTQVTGKNIRLVQYGTGGYNRILAEVFSRGRNINLHMVETGMAEVYQGRLPPGLDAQPYKSAEKRAKKNRIGIWSLGKKYKSPRQWRKENPRL